MRAHVAALLAFLEAFLTVEVPGLTAVMIHGETYVWPNAAAIVIVTMGASLAGVRRVQAVFAPPPSPFPKETP